MMMTINDLLAYGRRELKGSSPSSSLDAELLLCAVLQCTRVELIRDAYVKEVSLEQQERYRALIARRKAFEPVAYILGEKEFWGIKFKVTPDVLIPRPESELIVELSLKFLSNCSDPLSLLDLGTGSGNLIIAIASELKSQGRSFKGQAVDRSKAALKLAQENAAQLGVLDLINFSHGDWFGPLANQKFDLIVSNPPYIALDDKDRSVETKFEPVQALFSGVDGLDDIRAILSKLALFLTEKGRAFIEIGSGQAQQVLKLLPAYGLYGSVLQDLACLDRVVEIRH